MTLFGVYMARVDPEFLEARFKLHEKEPAQRRLVRWCTPLAVVWYLLPGLDQRFGWSHVPLWLTVVAQVLTVLAYLGVLGVFLSNRWAGRTIETKPGQRLVDTGPYAVVRHPMYAAALVMYAAMPLALGSWWGLASAAWVVPFLVQRIGGEEEVLLRELQGYAEYQRRVRFRLIPSVW